MLNTTWHLQDVSSDTLIPSYLKVNTKSVMLYHQYVGDHERLSDVLSRTLAEDIWYFAALYAMKPVCPLKYKLVDGNLQVLLHNISWN